MYRPFPPFKNSHKHIYFLYVTEVLDSRVMKYIHSKYGPHSTETEKPSWANSILPNHMKAVNTGKVNITNLDNNLPIISLPHANSSTHSRDFDLSDCTLPYWLLSLHKAPPFLSTLSTFCIDSFLGALLENLTIPKSTYGSAMPYSEILEVINNIPSKAETPPVSSLKHDINQDIILEYENLAVATNSGWRFQAGQTYLAAKHIWLNISQHNQIVRDQLTIGWKAPTFCQLKPAWFASLPFSQEEQKAWDEEVISLWQMGAVQMVDQQWVQKWGLPLVVMPVFLVKEPTKFRPILDARYSNLAFNPKWFSLPTILDFTTLLTKDMFWFKTDQKAGWQHLLLHPLHSQLFGFVWNNKLFVYTSPPFGDATAPWIFTYMGNTLKRLFRSHKVLHICYIDDFLFPGSINYEQTCSHRLKVINLEKSLGTVLGTPKCPLPAQEGEALGFFISTSQGIITISKKRFTKIATILEAFCQHQSAPIKTIARLVGLIVSCAILHPQTLWFVALFYPILAQVKTISEWRKITVVPKQAIKRVYKWLNHVQSNPRRLWVNPNNIRWVSSDATLFQVGAAVWQQPPDYLVPTSCSPILARASSRTVCLFPINIAHKEGEAVPWALDLFWKFFPTNCLIHWAVDNMVALGALRKGYSSTPYLQEVVDKFMNLAIQKRLVVLFHYVPSRLNLTSDWLSRLVETKNDWQLTKFYWQKFLNFCNMSKLPKPTVDCFAASHNKRCTHYHSRFLDSHSRGDFFSASLSPKEVHWANPPFSSNLKCISKAFQKFYNEQVQVWFLLPIWTAQPWWSWTSLAMASFPLIPTADLPIFSPVVKTNNFQPIPGWRVRIFFFDFRSQPPTSKKSGAIAVSV